MKSWWHPLAIINTSESILNLHDNNFELKAQFQSKLILIQQLDEEDWIKLVYIEYVTYIFLMAIRPHVCELWNTTKQKIIKKKFNGHL